MLWPYLPWDSGTTPDARNRTDAERMAALLKATRADGVNGDSMIAVPEAFYLASVAAGRPAAMEAESGGTEESVNWDTMGMGYWGGSMGHYTGGGGHARDNAAQCS